MDKKLYILAELDNDTQIILKKYDNLLSENGLVGKQTKDIPYHITLCSYSLEHKDYLNNLLEKICSEFKEINVSYSGFGLFGLNVLYLNPAFNSKIIEMYYYIKEKSYQKDEDLSAHTTLLIDEPENIIKMLPIFVNNSSKINGKIKYISLWEFFPVRLIKRVELM